jgi:neopullulanase
MANSKKIRTILTFLVLLIFSKITNAQNTQAYPTNWWTGMQWNKVQILLHNPNNGFSKAKFTINHKGVSLLKVNDFTNKNYAALDVVVASNAATGFVQIVIDRAGLKETINWPLLKRNTGNGKAFAQGVNPTDLIYLLMPDRFANGDVTNDRIAGLKDQSLNRDSMYLRHGGDLQGVIGKLDYLKDLGVTTVWMTPVFLNDMPNRTEHGYAATNHYIVDERLGGAAMYKRLSAELHKRNMKLIQDAVYNHVGIEHFFIKDMPAKDWVNQWPTFTQTSYRDQVLFDPHAAPSQTKKMRSGWFTKEMPDLNQNNPFVANFLIQHALWSVEEFGVDGWRIDTYAYNDLNFMNRCNAALIADFPAITMFGETWVHGVVNQSYFCENNMNISVKSNLQNTTDFQTLFYGITPALTEKQGWTEGVTKLYNTAAQDFIYKNPQNQLIFLGNHDLSRFFSTISEDMEKYKMALGWLLTFRGVPQLYYGDEIGMTGFSDPDGRVRSDFLGGWATDKTNKFSKEGRSEKENSIHDYISTLANFRKTATAVTNGEIMQYVPENGVYTYFRYNSKQTIMCVMNTGEGEMEINAAEKFTDRAKGFTSMQNVLTKEKLSLTFKIKSKEMIIAELYR